MDVIIYVATVSRVSLKFKEGEIAAQEQTKKWEAKEKFGASKLYGRHKRGAMD